jgi:hypothetical protein
LLEGHLDGPEFAEEERHAVLFAPSDAKSSDQPAAGRQGEQRAKPSTLGYACAVTPTK